MVDGELDNETGDISRRPRVRDALHMHICAYTLTFDRKRLGREQSTESQESRAPPTKTGDEKEHPLSHPYIRAVIFDCDGVLVDSEGLHATASQEELRDRGIDVPDQFFHDYMGMRVIDQLAILAERYGVDHATLFEARERRFWAMAAKHIREVPGSADTVRLLSAAGLSIAVATSGSRRWIDYVIDELHLGTEISASVSADDVEHPKPHPQPYLLAADALGIAPERCGAVEDSGRGCRSAVAAGCVVAVLDRDNRAPEQFAGAAAITNSWAEAREFLLSAAALDIPTERSASS